jgi:hypothetical protein
VEPLNAQQLHPVLVGDRILGFVAPQGVQRRSGKSRVVAEAVAIGNGCRQRFIERFGLHHLQAHPADRQFAGDLANQAAVRGTRAD